VFTLLLGNSCVVAHPPTEKPVEGTDVLITCGHGLGGAIGVVWWEVIGYNTAYLYYFPFKRYYMQSILVPV